MAVLESVGHFCVDGVLKWHVNRSVPFQIVSDMESYVVDTSIILIIAIASKRTMIDVLQRIERRAEGLDP